MAWLGACAAEFHPALSRRHRAFAILSLLTVLLLMAIDYFWIYRPLVQMVTPPGGVRPAAFIMYHQASKYINMVGLIFASVAAIAVNWPRRCDG
jgi:hypothetical protein